jgi:hypothetical protein
MTEPMQHGMRVSERDREIAARQLNDAYADGRLSLDESTERIAQVQDAVYQADLAALVQDLPPLAQAPVRQQAPAPRANSGSSPIDWVISLFGDARRQGRWTAPERIICITPFGDVKFDYRDATFAGAASCVIHITIFGDTKIDVPPGVRVGRQAFTIFGDQDGGDMESDDPAAPTIRLRHFSIFGDLKIRS